MWAKDLINFIPIYCHHWDCGLRQVQVRQASSQFIAIIGTADSDKCRCVKPEGTYGAVKCPSRWQFLNLICIPWYFCFNHGTQGTEMGSQLCPTLLLDLRPEAGYTFAPFGVCTVCMIYNLLILYFTACWSCSLCHIVIITCNHNNQKQIKLIE